MKFASLSNGSFKRLRETPPVDLRPRKKSSPTPSDSESDNESNVNNKWRNSLDQVFKRRNTSNNLGRKRRWKNKGPFVRTAQNPPSPVNVTPGPTSVKNGPRWEDARIDSVIQLATISPFNEEKVTRHMADLTLVTPSSPTPPIALPPTVKPHPIFQMPEIVENILRFVSAYAEIPREKPYARRKPLSLEHAKLIYKDEKKAMEVWNNRSQIGAHNSNGDGNEMMGSVMYNCMMVNRLWFHVTLELLLEKFHFKDLTKFRRFLNVKNQMNTNKKLIKPKMMVLHKFHKLQQSELDELSRFLSCESLKWLEFYICPDVVPPVAWINQFNNLEKLVLPGNKKIDDKFLIQVSGHVNNLKVLDLRACDKVTDSGIIAMAIRCPQLQACNLGRHRNSSNITSLAVVALARNTDVETLGMAGCKITDAGLWELAQLRGSRIKRLSLNNCDLLTNHSIPTLLALNYFPNLAVLELRHVDQITEVKQLVKFKLWKRSQNIPVLIEGCERITRLMYDEENRIRKSHSLLAFEDMSTWVNTESEL
ncbi:ZYRO0F08712p [Zygosaccharomyces rouxii]|uniref:ZYRO0F08712p n=1 Tax=Zygosaccharomyces rouxii (strain ATCC 2623 / CBS 732 / NBRC 1130 / NCYC 568 / NRRL Y-229) TaxID=559307 RepID=C5DXY3_ZYGRC|nr:uncharacterized protein ZYRO0F08712g [Zygosaccharomyces rouxii]KAH9199401.1 hypothetical protein LQ764DRAFT_129628 [Zygosaccharomyces rouxii]CAR28644.1 ZYRO0F08712p [Zygosaccharomyces rouxii]